MSSSARGADNAALLHDVGKLAIDGALLNKQGPLDDHERASLRRHCATGAEMSAGLDSEMHDLAFAVACPRAPRGSGYPRGLRGGDLPISARTLATVDEYDAVRSPQVFSADAQAKECLEAHAGTLFEPTALRALADRVGGLRRGALASRARHPREAAAPRLASTSLLWSLLGEADSDTAFARRR